MSPKARERWIDILALLTLAVLTLLFFYKIGSTFTVAWAVVGILLVIAGAVIWIRRYPQDREPHQE